MSEPFIDNSLTIGDNSLTIVVGILWIIVNIAFSIGVYREAKQRHTTFVGPGMWAFATLLGGVFIAVAYWIIHHSSLRSAP